MASELYVETLKGLTSGANANKVIVPAGQTLDASAGGFTTPAGHVIQVVQVDKDNESSTTSSSYADLGLSASITPSSTSSKILILVSSNIQAEYNSVDGSGHLALFKDSDSTPLTQARYEQRSISRITFGVSIVFLNSPSTTSSVTYSVKGKTTTGSFKLNDGGEDQGASITLMEIAG